MEIPEYFYRLTNVGHPIAYTVGELKIHLADLPDDLKIKQGFNKGVELVVYNYHSADRHLEFNETDED